MHKGSISRMNWFVENYVSTMKKTDKLKVLDVGSFDVNGSYKHLFSETNFDYVGLDMEAGPNVDLVLNNPYDWKEIETDSFDIVISGQAFEHIEFFWITMSEMARVLRKDGLLCIIAPNGIIEHRYPVDCYRFYTDGMVALARYVSLETLHAHTNLAPNKNDKDWFTKACLDSMLIARKNYSGNTQLVNIATYVCKPSEHVLLNSNLVPPPPSGSIFLRGYKKAWRLTKLHWKNLFAKTNN